MDPSLYDIPPLPPPAPPASSALRLPNNAAVLERYNWERSQVFADIEAKKQENQLSGSEENGVRGENQRVVNGAWQELVRKLKRV